MTDADLCLCVDLGTGGPKVGLVTLDGAVIATEVHAVGTHFGDDGSAVQDAGEWWTLIMESAARLLARPDASPSRVRAVAVTGQYASTVPVDANGVPTGPCVTWLDTRGVPHNRRAVGGPIQGYHPTRVLRFIRATAGAPSVSSGDGIGHLLYLTHEQPALVAASRWLLEPVDYLTMRFTGVAAATHASQLANWLTDTRHLDRYEYDRGLMDLVGLGSERLAPLVPFGSVVGPVQSSVAAALGLASDVAVVTGVPDLHAAAFGAGATRPYDAHLALSTTSWISCPVNAKKTDIAHVIATVPGLTNDSYLVINNQETGAKTLEWLQEVLAGSGAPLSLDEMTSLAATSPPGARGVVFTPWLAGERSPVEDNRARGGFTNLSITTTTADLVRAVLEGVAANSRWLLGYVERFAGRPLAPMRLVGGGAQSDLWCQIYADTLGREVIQIDQPRVAQLRGVALLASVATGRRSLDDVAALGSPGRVFEPDGATRAMFDARQGELASLFARDRRWRRSRRVA